MLKTKYSSTKKVASAAFCMARQKSKFSTLVALDRRRNKGRSAQIH